MIFDINASFYVVLRIWSEILMRNKNVMVKRN